MKDWRPKLRADVHAHVISPTLAVLDTRSGIELLEGRLAAALAPLLKGELPIAEMIAQVGGASHTLHVVYTLEELRRRGLLEAGELPEDGGEPEEVSPGNRSCQACIATRVNAVRKAWQLPETRHSQQAHVCDPSARRDFRPVVLQSRTKAATFDGGHRAVAPEETYARYEHLISPLTGIVHHVERAHADPGPLNVFFARHNFILGSQTTPGRSFGKGMTAAQARTGALCEALERHAGIFRGDEPLLRASLRDLGHDAVHPNVCLGVSERQYRERNEWNSHAPPLLWIPEPFDEEHETGWAPAWSLTHERKRYVGAALCYYGYRDTNNDYAHADSNGSAAGTSIEDAVLQGLLELVERDAAGIWWYGRIRRPAVALETPYLKAMHHEHAARGRQLSLLDLTTDLGIPVCAAVSVAEDGFHLGFGAHLDPAIAVTRAVTEANQLLAVRRPRRVFRGELMDWTFLEPQGSREPCTSIAPSDDLRTDVFACVDVLRQHGLEVIVLDQTREDTGLPVVKVIVPGLRHFRPRFAPGRLYDVPVQLGWMERPLREDELNPAHMTS